MAKKGNRSSGTQIHGGKCHDCNKETDHLYPTMRVSGTGKCKNIKICSDCRTSI